MALSFWRLNKQNFFSGKPIDGYQIITYIVSIPKIFEQDGFTFFFYMNEHLPVHVHVMSQGNKAKLEIVGGKAVAVIPGRLSVSDLKKAERIASENSGLIADRWRETFDK